MTPSEKAAYQQGIRVGIECAAERLDSLADLASTVIETNCSEEAASFRERAEDIRKLKDKLL